MSKWSGKVLEKNSSQNFLSMSDPFGVQVNTFVTHFQKSSKRFVIEILTTNFVLNLSGALFFMGLGCSLKWWYKDQLFIILLKQNLPAFNEPQQKLFWETSEYVLNKQNPTSAKQTFRKPQLAVPLSIAPITTSTQRNPCTTCTTEGGNGGNNSANGDTGGIANISKIANYTEGTLPLKKSFIHLLLPSIYFNSWPSIVLQPDSNQRYFSYPSVRAVLTPFPTEEVQGHPTASYLPSAAKHRYGRSSGMETKYSMHRGTPSTGVWKSCTRQSEKLANFDFGNKNDYHVGNTFHNLFERLDLYMNHIVVKFKPPWQKHAYQRFVGLFSAPNLKKSIRRTCSQYPLLPGEIINEKWATDLGFTTSDKLVDKNNHLFQKKFSTYTTWKPLLPETWFKLSARNLCLLKDELPCNILQPTARILGENWKFFTCFRKPIICSLLSVTSLHKMKNPLRLLPTRAVLPADPVRSTGVEVQLPPDARKGQYSFHSVDRIPDTTNTHYLVSQSDLLRKIDLGDKEQLGLENSFTTKLARNSNLTDLYSVILGTKLIKLRTILGKNKLSFLKNGSLRSIQFSDKQILLGSETSEQQLFFPLELTKTMAGWQPPSNALLLNSYLDEIPYKLESASGNKPGIHRIFPTEEVADSKKFLSFRYEKKESEIFLRKAQLFEMKELLKQELEFLIHTLNLVFVDPSIANEQNNVESNGNIKSQNWDLKWRNLRSSKTCIRVIPNELEIETVSNGKKNELTELAQDTQVNRIDKGEHNKIRDKSKQQAISLRSEDTVKVVMGNQDQRNKNSSFNLFLVNNLGFTFNNLSSLNSPPILLPINNDASFWKWNFPSLPKSNHLIFKQKNEKFLSPQNATTNDTIFHLYPKSLIWEIFQQPNYEQPNYKKLRDTVSKNKIVNVKNCKKKINFNWLNHTPKNFFQQKITTIAKTDSINIVDKGINFVNKRSRFMSGYVYPDLQSQSLRKYFYQWLNTNKIEFNKERALSTLDNWAYPFFPCVATYTDTEFANLCKSFTDSFTAYTDKKSNKKTLADKFFHMVWELRSKKSLDPLTKESRTLHFTVNPRLTQQNEMYWLCYPESFRGINRLLDSACLSNIEIPITSAIFPPVSPLPPLPPSVVQVGQTIQEVEGYTKIDPLLLLLMETKPMVLPTETVRSKKSMQCFLLPYEKFNHRLAFFPGFAKPSQFLLTLPKISQGDYVKINAQENLLVNNIAPTTVTTLPLRSDTVTSADPLPPSSSYLRYGKTEYRAFGESEAGSTGHPTVPVERSSGMEVKQEVQLPTYARSEHRNRSTGAHDFTSRISGIDKFLTDCNVRGTAYRGIVIQRNKFTKDLEPFKETLGQSSIWGILLLGPENPVTDRQCHFFGQKQLSTLDFNNFQRDYLRQLGKEIVAQANRKGFTEKLPSIERTKILSLSKTVNSFFLKKRKYAYFLEKTDYWHLLFQEQLRTALEDTRKYPPLTPEETKNNGLQSSGRIKISAPLIITRFPKEIAKTPLSTFSVQHISTTCITKDGNGFSYPYSSSFANSFRDISYPFTSSTAVTKMNILPPIKINPSGSAEQRASYLRYGNEVGSIRSIGHNEGIVRYAKEKPEQVLKGIQKAPLKQKVPELQHGMFWRPFCYVKPSFLLSPSMPGICDHMTTSLSFPTKEAQVILPFPTVSYLRYGRSSGMEEAQVGRSKPINKTIYHYPLLTERQGFELTNTPWRKNIFSSIMRLRTNQKQVEGVRKGVFECQLRKPYSSFFASPLPLPSVSFPNNLQLLIQEPLTANSWAVICQWFFLIALLFWIEQMFLRNIFPALFALEQILLGTTGIKTSDRTHIIRVSKPLVSNTPKFQDLAGVDGLLGELSELVLFLRGHKERLWNKKSSYGVLLTGPPGTGKTFLVRALANEARVPVLILSAGTLVASKLNTTKPSWAIRHAFRRAKQLAPCILFIDEIDALGKSRGKIVTDSNEIITSTFSTSVPLTRLTTFEAGIAYPSNLLSRSYSPNPLRTVLRTYSKPFTKMDLDPQLRKRSTGHPEEAVLLPRRGQQEVQLPPYALYSARGKYSTTRKEVQGKQEQARDFFERCSTNIVIQNQTITKTIETNVFFSGVFSYQQSWPSVSNFLINKWENPIKSLILMELNQINRCSICENNLFNLVKAQATIVSNSKIEGKGTNLKSSPQLLSTLSVGRSSGMEKPSANLRDMEKRTAGISTDSMRHSSNAVNNVENMTQNSMENGNNNQRKFGPLTQLLVSMDGVSNLSGVLIMGATNRPELLDSALTRPGRFERIIRIEKPSEQKRIEILQLYSHNLGVQHEIPWHYLANRTRGLTAADLAVAMNYSSLKAIIQGSTHTIETIEYGLNSITRFFYKPFGHSSSLHS